MGRPINKRFLGGKGIILEQTHEDFDGAGDNGTFAGGTGYSKNDVIVLSNGAVISVTDDADGVITEFKVIASGDSVLAGTVIEQQSVEPTGGSGFTLTVGADNLSNGFQISATVNVNVGEGVERGLILRQRSNSKYLVQGVNSGVQAVCRLVPALAPDLGEMSVAVLSDVKGLATLKDLQPPQNQTNFDGAGDNGTFVGGTGYAVSDTIELSNGAVITVDDVDGGAVTEFTVTSVGDVFAADSTLTSGDGSGFELTPGVANRDPKPEFARNINNRTVKTFLGNVYSWPDDVNVVGRATSNIQGE